MWKAKRLQKSAQWIKKGRWQFAGKLLLSLGLLGLVLYFVDFRELGDIVVNLDSWYLTACIAITYLDRALMAYKWNLLLRVADVRVPFSLLFRTYLISPLIGILLPSSIGSDLFRVYHLSRYSIDALSVVAAIIVERVIGFIALLLLTLVSLGIALYLMRDSWPYFKEVGAALLLCGVIAAGLIGTALRSFKFVVYRLGSRFANHPFVDKLRQAYVLYSEYRNHFGIVLIVTAWTFVELMTSIFSNFLLVRALHVNVSLLEVVAMLPLIMLAARLPISLNGIGVVEGLAVAMFGLVGVSAAETLLLTTLGRAIWILCGFPWAIHYLFKGHQVSVRTQDTF
jgi:uncharacterized protein (TIRG00374 family)